MSFYRSRSDKALFGRLIDDYLLYGGVLFSDKEAHEFEDKYIVEISVPGFNPENLELIADNGALVLRGFEITKTRRLFYTRITKIPIFQRSLVLPPDVAPNTIFATYRPGNIQIICPKQIIPFNHNRSHYLIQTRRIKIKGVKKRNSWLDWFR